MRIIEYLPRDLASHYPVLLTSKDAFLTELYPCIRLERVKFELTNPDSRSGETVLS